MKKYKKDTKDMIVAGTTLGVGSAVLSGLPTTGAGTGASTALGSMSSFMPVMGTVSGAGAVIRATKGMYPTRRRKKKR